MPEPKKKKLVIGVTLSQEIFNKVVAQAAEEKTSLAGLVKTIVEKYYTSECKCTKQ